MNRILLATLLCFLPISGPIGCATAPSSRVAEVKTLQVVGASVDTAMKLAAQLYHDGKMGAAQWDQVAAIHGKFRPAYNLAVAAVQADLSSPASPDLAALAAQLVALVATFSK